MKTRSLVRAAIACTVLALSCAVGFAADSHDRSLSSVLQGGQGPGAQPRPSEAEIAASKKVREAATIDLRLDAASEFVKKFPQSSMRKQLATMLVQQIAGTQSAEERVGAAEKFSGIFTDPAEASMINPIIVDSYVEMKKFDEAFMLGGALLQKNPGNPFLLTQLAIVGLEQMKQGNKKFVSSSMEYGTRAIDLFEKDARPADADAAAWADYKAQWLPVLYQSMSLASMDSNKMAEARINLEKAIALRATDPLNYYLLGNVLYTDVQANFAKYKPMPAGQPRLELEKKIFDGIDKVIELYAQAVAIASTKPDYVRLHDQVLEDLKANYKFRHNGSEAGLKELIEKHKLSQLSGAPIP